MRIITIHLPLAPAGDGSIALQFIGHHGFFVEEWNGDKWEVNRKLNIRCSWVESTKTGKEMSIAQVSECGWTSIRFD